MSNGFVPLDVFLKPAPRAPQPQSSVAPLPEPVVPEELETALRAARRFRAALSDALDAALPSLLRAIADDVLARELRLEPAAVARVVVSALDRAADEHVVAIRVHPSDHGAVASLGIRTIADAALTPGDCRIELHSGTIESTLRLRLENVLAAHAP
jgi:flagellar biosynthesis/type III secretory pathway protein FliH